MNEMDQMGWILGLIIFAFAIALIPAIFFVRTLQKTLQAISPENRLMQPGQVWLLFIPVFNIAWMFIVVVRLSDALKNECIRLNISTQEERPTYSTGMAMCILYVCSIVPILGAFASLVALVCWILYWIKVNGFKNLIIANRDNFLLDAEREALQSSAH